MAKSQMTEHGWRICSYPTPMLELVRGKASARKLQMFASACYRHVWDLVDESVRQLVEAADLLVDKATQGAKVRGLYSQIVNAASDAANAAAGAEPTGKDRGDAALDRARHKARTKELRHQSDLLRDIFGNPLRPATVDPAWRTANAVALAQSIYEERAFDRLPILADALEDAGCDHADILEHCRGPGPHVRGCWVVDLILAKE